MKARRSWRDATVNKTPGECTTHYRNPKERKGKFDELRRFGERAELGKRMTRQGRWAHCGPNRRTNGVRESQTRQSELFIILRQSTSPMGSHAMNKGDSLGSPNTSSNRNRAHSYKVQQEQHSTVQMMKSRSTHTPALKSIPHV
jgi:hypothetical protein